MTSYLCTLILAVVVAVPEKSSILFKSKKMPNSKLNLNLKLSVRNSIFQHVHHMYEMLMLASTGNEEKLEAHANSIVVRDVASGTLQLGHAVPELGVLKERSSCCCCCCC